VLVTVVHNLVRRIDQQTVLADLPPEKSLILM